MMLDKVVREREVKPGDLTEPAVVEADDGVAKKLSIFLHVVAFN